MYFSPSKLNIMAKKNKISMLEPSKDDLDILRQEVGEGGYFGWVGTKKHAKTKAMLKAELWQTQNNEPKLKYRICIIYNIGDDAAFEESYLAGALYEDSGTLLTDFVDKIKGIDVPSIVPILNMFSSQPQT